MAKLKNAWTGNEGYATVVAEVDIEQDGKTRYVSLVDYDGIPSFYNSEISLFEYHIGGYTVHDRLFDDTVTDYEEIPEGNVVYRYLAYIINLEPDVFRAYLEETKGKDLEGLEIPDYNFE